MTRYEAEILQIINTSYDHSTAEEVFFKLKEKEPGVVLATVYNNLNKLFKSGEIIKLSIEGQPDRYDKKLRHDHLVCSVCGKIQDYNFPDLKDKIEKELGTEVEGYDLKVSYICPECRVKRR